MKMKALSALLLAAGLLPGMAMAGSSPWMLRSRIINIDPDASGNASPVAPGLGIDVDNRWGLDLDISYFITPNWSATLLLSYPQKHDLTVDTIGDIGSLKQLPPTLGIEYHFDTNTAFKPYVGAGVTYFLITDDDDLNVPGIGQLNVDDTWGVGIRLGFDYDFGNNWYFNADVKKIWLGVDIKDRATGGRLIDTNLDIDPWVYGVGIGYRF